MKCHETTRCGFFLYAHPVFTYRHDFVEILTPILTQNIWQGPDFEYDVQPEKLTINAGMKKTSEKVVLLRTTPTYAEEVQLILTNLFGGNDTTDIGPLRKYMFVPINIAGDTNKTTLQGLMRTQQNFCSNVYHYIVTNVRKFHKQFQVSCGENSQDAEMEDTTASEESSATKEPAATNDDQPPTREAYSLRKWMYDLQDDNGDELIHAVYPSSDEAKIFVLCEKIKAVQVLQLLHNLLDLSAQVFPKEALVTYFGPNKDLALVHNHPRTTAELS